MVTSAEIRAKVCSVKPIDRFEWELIVLIKEISYTQKQQSSKNTQKGKVMFNDFYHKTTFNFNPDITDDRYLETKISRLTNGDIINFSVEKSEQDYRFLSLEVENETPFGKDDLKYIVEKYGQICEE